MPPSNVSLKRSRKVPETVFFSSRRTRFRLTKPMTRLRCGEQLRGAAASGSPRRRAECQRWAAARPTRYRPLCAGQVISLD